MTTQRKTSKEISDAIITQLETSLNTTIPLLPKSFCRVLAKALGLVFVLLYQFAGWIMLQMFVKTASNEPFTIGGITIRPLAMWGSLVDVFQDAGQRAELTITIDVITQTGSLTSGMRVVNPATEIIYTLVNDVPLDASTKSATIRATEAGALGNVDAGETLNFVSPPSSVEKAVSVTARTVDGVDPEDTEVFRQHVLDRWSARPQGGAYADYRDWAQEVSGVLNAYPYSGWSFIETYPSQGAGYVFIYIESTSDTDGIPPDPGALLTAVETYANANVAGLATRRNINAFVKAKPITRTTIDVAIEGLYPVEDKTEIEAAVLAGLTEFFLDRGPFILGLHLQPRKDIIHQMDVGGVVGKIVASRGAYVNTVTMSISAVETQLHALQEGEKAKMGTLTWT